MSAKGRRAVANGLHDLVKEKVIFFIYLFTFTFHIEMQANEK